ncbi:hypothetical protein P5673_007089 [Acropora cervicornis]|uniref:Uncharacterized protein n=1 Tax=Acropora cervicornis TaxID=6130 RepID=A0AAD9QX01_ACRCE|nr:hypothetical protein P5673_007089 [Acropora cervicornis]
MVRGDPVFLKENCSQYDIGLVFKEISSYSDQDKLKFTENAFETGGWLKRFSWLAYSKFLDGAFCLLCVLFGVQSGQNSNNLDKLYKTPFTLCTSATSCFTKNASRKCEMHNFSLIVMDNFLQNMTKI